MYTVATLYVYISRFSKKVSKLKVQCTVMQATLYIYYIKGNLAFYGHYYKVSDYTLNFLSCALLCTYVRI